MGCMALNLTAMATVESRKDDPDRDDDGARLRAKLRRLQDKPAPPERVDFSHVKPSAWRMHDRLENWARWCRGTQRQVGSAGSPMFSLYQSTEAKRKYGEDTATPLDPMDAQAVAKGVALLPDKHRRAIHWSYLHPRNPSSAARELGVSLQGLAELVHNGRQMLVNRGV